jgi:apolipoprotein N-acyltransferase
MEIPTLAIVRPIPRAIWTEKPSELSVSLEDLAGVSGDMTMAATFVGEGYMSLGFLGVVAFGLFLGGAGRWWTEQTAAARSEFGFVVYGSGLYALLVSMRSAIWFVAGILPACAAIIALFVYSWAWRSTGGAGNLR